MVLIPRETKEELGNRRGALIPRQAPFGNSVTERDPEGYDVRRVRTIDTPTRETLLMAVAS